MQRYTCDKPTGILEHWHTVESPGIDTQPWFQISTYFHLRAELHTGDTLWTRQRVILRECWHATFSYERK